MKKICLITTISLTLNTFVLKTAEYLHAHTDWDISMICNTDEAFAASLPEYIHYYPIPMERGISSSGIKAMLEMYRIFSREKFDMIQYSTPNASLYASIAGALARIPIRLYCQWGMAFVGFHGLKRAVFKTVERFVCLLSTHIEPDSKSNLTFSHSQGLYPWRKGSVVWNGSACGVCLDKFDVSKKPEYRDKTRDAYGIPESSFVFGFVGRITRDKGINELLYAFKKLYTGNEYLLIVGPSEVDATVDRALLDWAHGNNHVIFTGFTNVVEKYLSAMDCYLLPSYREGFGMGVVEAEAMGVPVIITDIPGPIDAMQDHVTGTIVPVQNADALHSAMQEMMTHPDLAQQYGQAGITFVREHFDQSELHRYILEDRKRLLDYVSKRTHHLTPR